MKKVLLFMLLFAMQACQPEKEESVWMLGFEKPAENPILTADSSYTFFDPIQKKEVQWQKADVFNPAAVVRNDSLYLLFRAEDNPKAILGHRTSRIGLAVSTDGIRFQKYASPVLYPEPGEFLKWDYPGGVEDPRVVETEDGTYVMLYTSWNKETARLSAASSPDLKQWQKHGPVFEQAHQGRFLNSWSKSGSVVTKMTDGRLKATKINGKYWMYWGEEFVNLAHSDNLLDWHPLLDDKGELLKVMERRANKFDSRLTEPGPPAMLTENGILLLYNGKNHDEGDKADPAIPVGTYSGGQALFDKNDPAKFLSRLDTPFIRPDLPHEITGQYKAGTTFIEGLVFYKNRWYLYYGTADSMVGLAIKE
jgi:predicted GH43/DUF377 family glycosyl hydrolase